MFYSFFGLILNTGLLKLCINYYIIDGLLQNLKKQPVGRTQQNLQS